MEIIAGKNGSFFVVNKNADTDTIRKLKGITLEEFVRYNAWATMKRISNISDEEYAEKNLLRLDILRKFDRFAEAVVLKATQDLTFFIDDENGGVVNSENFTNPMIFRSREFKNSFAYPVPRETPCRLTDAFAIPDADVPEMLKVIGGKIDRVTVEHSVKWNNVTYKVDISTDSPETRRAFTQGLDITIAENCYNFTEKDWNWLKEIDTAFCKEKSSRQNSWYRLNKPENEILNGIIGKIFKNDHRQRAMYAEMYKKFRELRDTCADYQGVYVHEFHRLRNRILLQNRYLKPNVKALSAADIYYIMVENERSAHLAVTIDRINKYWQDHDWQALLAKEPCLEVLRLCTEDERNSLLSNLDFVTNVKLKYWTENSLEKHASKIIANLPIIQKYSSVSKEADTRRLEYILRRSMLYSYNIYNPETGKYRFVRLDKYIKIDIPVSGMIITNVINKIQGFIDKKRNAKELLKIKYGFNDEMIKKAATIYESAIRFGKA